MEVAVNDFILKLCDCNDIDYFIEWVTGYLDKQNIITLLKNDNNSIFNGNNTFVQIHESVIERVRKKFEIETDAGLQLAINTILLVSFSLGCGE